MIFTISAKDKKSHARAGRIKTDHGSINTPVFMPIGTLGTVKAINVRDLEREVKARIMLCNTYHLYLRPGLSVIKKAGGLHKFNNWKGPILTDSGGYQVYSLAKIRKITEKGVSFQSHIDGSAQLFTPENVITSQRVLGSDIMMAFDDCTDYPCEYDYAKKSMELTHRWLKRCVRQFDKTKPIYGHSQALFPIVQGSTYKDLRTESAEVIAEAGMAGNAIGGLSVGEPEEIIYEMTDLVCSILPENKPRYLMGVGTPVNLLEAISLGVDMFDCVIPSRNGRNGMLYTGKGIINIKNKKWQRDFSPIDKESKASASREYSKAFLRHMMLNKEILASQISTLQNLSFYTELMAKAREHILKGTFEAWKRRMIPKLRTKL
ncbi:MAG: tRNA guanosine(34) transglycosylase Tgt [Bacteroidetes bacterium]|nr:tRNA guanosine(34) transglycosylase Tgt [Bacteroidota bacterium]